MGRLEARGQAAPTRLTALCLYLLGRCALTCSIEPFSFFFPLFQIYYFGGKPESSWSWQKSLSTGTKPQSRWAHISANHSGSCWALGSVISSRNIWTAELSSLLPQPRGANSTHPARADVAHKRNIALPPQCPAGFSPKASGPALAGKDSSNVQAFSASTVWSRHRGHRKSTEKLHVAFCCWPEWWHIAAVTAGLVCWLGAGWAVGLGCTEAHGALPIDCIEALGYRALAGSWKC